MKNLLLLILLISTSLAANSQQKKRTRQKSSFRVAVENPFAFTKNKILMQLADAKTMFRKSSRFDLNCIINKVLMADY